MSDDQSMPRPACTDETPARELDKQIGRRIALRRELLRMSIDQLASRSGLDQALVERYEQGVVRCPAHVLANLAQELNVATFWFFADLTPQDEASLAPAVDQNGTTHAPPSADMTRGQLLQLFDRIPDPEHRRLLVALAGALAAK